MKKKFFFVLLLSGLLVIPAGAVHFGVNNQLKANPAAKIFTTLQAAHYAAVNKDTIMVEGSPLIYGDAFTF